VNDEAIKESAVAFARTHKKKIGKRLTDTTIFPPEKDPVAVFMAGSPGAGKTEASKALIADFEKKGSPKKLRIDPDDLRTEFEMYNGTNSHLFQYPISILVSKMIDLAHENRQSFLLDGTLSNLEQARKNIKRCLEAGRRFRFSMCTKTLLLPGVLYSTERFWKDGAFQWATLLNNISPPAT
jgi:hypothetical protein